MRVLDIRVLQTDRKCTGHSVLNYCRNVHTDYYQCVLARFNKSGIQPSAANTPLLQLIHPEAEDTTILRNGSSNLPVHTEELIPDHHR